MKNLVKSKTILGIALAALVSLLPQFGVSFGSDDAALISDFWDLAVQTTASGFAVYGRMVAEGPLK